ncbi:MAG: hypothetical protein CME06_01245 [Gemmatimonadetes bacterium]|nr:hypothetical protein [Gemmatimonadota bacterium]
MKLSAVAVAYICGVPPVWGCMDTARDPAGLAAEGPGRSAVESLPESYEFMLAWGEPGDEPGQFQAVNSIAVAPDGTIYTGELHGLRIQRFTSTGVFLDSWGEPGEEPGRFVGIRGLTVAPWGDVYVSDVHPGTGEPARIQVFSPEGEFIRSFWQAGDGPDDFHMNWGLEIGPDGLLYVTDLNRGVLVFTRQGDFHSHWLYEPPLSSPSDIAFGWDAALAMDVAYIHARGPVKYEPLGDLLLDGSGSGYSTLHIATDNNDDIHVLRWSGPWHIEKRDSQFDLLALFGGHGTAPGEFLDIAGLAVDDSGYVYAGDVTLNRIQKFRKIPETSIAQTSWSTLKRSKH